MSEPVSRARGGLLDARYIECARPTGGSHGRIIRGPAQRRGDAKRRPRSTSTVVERGQGQYKGRSPKAPAQRRMVRVFYSPSSSSKRLEWPPGGALAGGGCTSYRLSAQRRHGTTSRRFNSSPTASAKTV